MVSETETGGGGAIKVLTLIRAHLQAKDCSNVGSWCYCAAVLPHRLEGGYGQNSICEESLQARVKKNKQV